MKRTDCCYKDRLERLNGIEERLNELKKKAADSDRLRKERNLLRCRLREFTSKYNDDIEGDSDEKADKSSRRDNSKKLESSLEKDQISHDENIMEKIKQEFITQIRSLEEANQLLQDKIKELTMKSHSVSEKLEKEKEIVENENNSSNDNYKDMVNDKNSMQRDDNVMETERLEYLTQIRDLEIVNQLLNKELKELAKKDGGSVGNRKLHQEKQILQNEFNDLKERFKGLAIKYENLEQQNSQLSLINKVILKESQNKLENANLAALELTTFADQMIRIRNMSEQIDQHPEEVNEHPPKAVTFNSEDEVLRKSPEDEDESDKVETQSGSTEPSSVQSSTELDVMDTDMDETEGVNVMNTDTDETEGVNVMNTDTDETEGVNVMDSDSDETEGVNDPSHKRESLEK